MWVQSFLLGTSLLRFCTRINRATKLISEFSLTECHTSIVGQLFLHWRVCSNNGRRHSLRPAAYQKGVFVFLAFFFFVSFFTAMSLAKETEVFLKNKWNLNLTNCFIFLFLYKIINLHNSLGQGYFFFLISTLSVCLFFTKNVFHSWSNGFVLLLFVCLLPKNAVVSWVHRKCLFILFNCFSFKSNALSVVWY